MQHPEVEAIRKLALEIATKTYSISSWDLMTTEQRADLKNLSYEQLLFLVDQKQHEHYVLTADDERALREEYEKITSDLTDQDTDYESTLSEIYKMIQHGHFSDRGHPHTMTSLMRTLDDLFEESLNEIKEKQLPYYIVKTGGWELEIDVRRRVVNICFNIYNSTI